MEYVILDLEWNGTFSKKLKGFFNEIIEFGAVRLDHTLKRLDSFSMPLVRPQIGKRISGKVKTLTNIKATRSLIWEPLHAGAQQVPAFPRGRRADDLGHLFGHSRPHGKTKPLFDTGSDRMPFCAGMSIW